MNKSSHVFLGGTCGHNHWREEIVIPGLVERGVSPQALFNPVVEHWDEGAQTREDEMKRTARWCLYVIASPDPAATDCSAVSGYSLVEATMSLYDAPERTVILVETTGMTKHTAKSVTKAATDWRQRFPDAPIFVEYAALLDWVARQVQRDRERVGSLGEKCVLPHGPESKRKEHIS